MYPRTFSPLPRPAVHPCAPRCQQCIPAPPSTLVMPVHWHHKEWILAPLKNRRHARIQYYIDRRREEKLPGVTKASTERGNSSTEPRSSTKDSQSAKYVEKITVG